MLKYDQTLRTQQQDTKPDNDPVYNLIWSKNRGAAHIQEQEIKWSGQAVKTSDRSQDQIYSCASIKTDRSEATAVKLV